MSKYISSYYPFKSVNGIVINKENAIDVPTEQEVSNE